MTKTTVPDYNSPLATKSDIDKVTQRTEYLFLGVMLILGLGFITLLVAVLSPIIDANRFRTETYQNLVNKVVEQNTEIETLINKVDDLKIQYENQKTLPKR